MSITGVNTSFLGQPGPNGSQRPSASPRPPLRAAPTQLSAARRVLHSSTDSPGNPEVLGIDLLTGSSVPLEMTIFNLIKNSLTNLTILAKRINTEEYEGSHGALTRKEILAQFRPAGLLARALNHYDKTTVYIIQKATCFQGLFELHNLLTKTKEHDELVGSIEAEIIELRNPRGKYNLMNNGIKFDRDEIFSFSKVLKEVILQEQRNNYIPYEVTEEQKNKARKWDPILNELATVYDQLTEAYSETSNFNSAGNAFVQSKSHIIGSRDRLGLETKPIDKILKDFREIITKRDQAQAESAARTKAIAATVTALPVIEIEEEPLEKPLLTNLGIRHDDDDGIDHTAEQPVIVSDSAGDADPVGSDLPISTDQPAKEITTQAAKETTTASAPTPRPKSSERPANRMSPPAKPKPRGNPLIMIGGGLVAAAAATGVLLLNNNAQQPTSEPQAA